MIEPVFNHTAFDGGDLVLFRCVDLGYALIGFIPVGIIAFAIGIVLVVAIFGGAQGSFFLGVRGFFGQQRFAVFLGDLVIVGMDFAERKKSVPVSAEIDECRLQRWFYSGYLGEVDIALDLLVISRFKVEFFNPIALQHRHPGFFLVARID